MPALLKGFTTIPMLLKKVCTRGSFNEFIHLLVLPVFCKADQTKSAYFKKRLVLFYLRKILNSMENPEQ